MSAAETYRIHAAQQRALAAETSLANCRAMHERSAETWETMARAAEDTADRTAVNAAAKVAA